MLRTSLTTEASKTEMRNRGQSKVSEDRVIIISNSENGIEWCLWWYKENGSYIPYCIAASKGDREKLHKQLIETLQTL